jgi:hypothetical protein
MLKVQYHCSFKGNSAQIGSNLGPLIKEIRITDTDLTSLQDVVEGT